MLMHGIVNTIVWPVAEIRTGSTILTSDTQISDEAANQRIHTSCQPLLISSRPTQTANRFCKRIANSGRMSTPVKLSVNSGGHGSRVG